MATSATSSEWLRVINSTTRNYVKGFEDAVQRRRKLLAKLKAAGKIKYNQGGDGIQWQPRRQRGTVTVNNGAQAVTHTPTNRFDKAFLDYQGYDIAEAITKREKLKNAYRPSQLIDIFGKSLEHAMEDLEDTFAEALYIDDSASGNTGHITGIESMLAGTNATRTSAQTIQIDATTPTARSYNAADPVIYPSDTYATISTALGNAGGSWSGPWPIGKGDAIYDYWSPLIVNAPSTYFGATSWAATNAVNATRFAVIFSRKNQSATSGQVNLTLFDIVSYYGLSTLLDGRERVVVTSNGQDREYGNPNDSIYIEGCECTWEYGVPNNVGYGFNTDMMELLSMQSELFAVDDWFWDRPSKSYRAGVDFLGNLKFKSPRNFFKLWTA